MTRSQGNSSLLAMYVLHLRLGQIALVACVVTSTHYHTQIGERTNGQVGIPNDYLNTGYNGGITQAYVCTSANR